MPKNALRTCYELTTIFGIGSSWSKFEQLKTFATNSRSLKNWKNWLRIKNNQLITSRTDFDSTTNPNIYQFVAIRGLCGMGALKNVQTAMEVNLQPIIQPRIKFPYKHRAFVIMPQWHRHVNKPSYEMRITDHRWQVNSSIIHILYDGIIQQYSFFIRTHYLM